MRIAIYLVVILAGGLAGWLNMGLPGKAEYTDVMHNHGIYPGGGTEVFCVRDSTGGVFTPAEITTIKNQINSWVNESAGWERVGSSISFSLWSGSCDSTSTETIEYNLTPAGGACGGNAGCLGTETPPAGSGPITHGHRHPTKRVVNMDGQFWKNWDWNPGLLHDNIVHETGHVLGVNHGDCLHWGATSCGWLWKGQFGGNPTQVEIDEVFDHMEGRPMRIVSGNACIGIRGSNSLFVSWFDPDMAETSHVAEVFRQLPGGPWTLVKTATQTPKTGIGQNVPFTITDLNIPSFPGAAYQVRARVIGGPLGNYSEDSFSNTAFQTTTTPTPPCLMNSFDTGSGAFIYWTDSASTEDGFSIERAYVFATSGPQKGQMGSFSVIANVSGADWNQYIDPNSGETSGYLPCYRVRTWNDVGAVKYWSSYSEVVCLGT